MGIAPFACSAFSGVEGVDAPSILTGAAAAGGGEGVGEDEGGPSAGRSIGGGGEHENSGGEDTSGPRAPWRTLAPCLPCSSLTVARELLLLVSLQFPFPGEGDRGTDAARSASADMTAPRCCDTLIYVDTTPPLSPKKGVKRRIDTTRLPLSDWVTWATHRVVSHTPWSIELRTKTQPLSNSCPTRQGIGRWLLGFTFGL